MKFISILFSIMLLVSACNHKSIIDKKISEYITKNAHNPDSYEPISTTPIDTVTEIENVKSKIKEKISSIQKDSSDIERNISMLKTDSSSVDLHKEIQQRHLKENSNLYATLDSMELASSIKDLNFWQEQLLSGQNLLLKDKEELGKLKIRLDSINKSSNPNSISRFHFLHRFRARVPIGGLMLKNAFIETDKDFNILTFVEQ